MLEHQRIRDLAHHKGIGQYKLKCPYCQHEREKHHHDKPLSLKIQWDGVQFHCFHCDTQGGWMSKEEAEASSEWDWDFSKAPPKQEPSMGGQEYLLSRGILQDLIDSFTHVGTYTFNGTPQPAIGFAYLEKAIKWRSTNKTKAFSQQNVCKDFYLLETYVPGNDILICEGEMDALAWKTAGLPDNITVLSVPNGAPAKVTSGKISPKEDKRFQYVWRARTQLKQAKRIYINTDDDDAGRALSEELSRRIGRARSWITALAGCKDASDALDKMGPEFLVDCFHHSEPLPMLGLHIADEFEESYSDLYENGRMKGATVGIASIDKLVSIPLGMMSIVTGFPGSGKSDLVDQFCVNLAQDHGWKTCYCSFEKQPDLHMAQLAQKMTGKSFFAPDDPFTCDTERMTADERDHAFTWIREHFMFMDSSRGGPTDIGGILDSASAAVMRMGCRVLVIDPYNYLSVDRSSGLETDAISDMLSQVRQWAREHDAHVFFVAHPSKPEVRTARYICGGNDVSKSAAWFAKADLGLTTWRGDMNESELHVWKVRWSWMGTLGKADLSHNVANSRWYDGVPDDYDWDW